MRPATSRTLASCLAAFLLLVFGTPLRVLWAHPGAPWWLVYTPWALAVVGLFGLARADHQPRQGAARDRRRTR
jgi:hypothetical protein